MLWLAVSSVTIWSAVSLATSPAGLPERYAPGAVALDGIVMFAGLNAGMGLYLIFASTNPARYRHTVDMFLLCQVLCALSVITLQMWAPAYHGRWIGQPVLTAFGSILVALIWCPARTRIGIESPQKRPKGQDVQQLSGPNTHNHYSLNGHIGQPAPPGAPE
ncbi:hypothetical protein BI330_15700 [Mycobacterium sp. CBMA 623]|nr:hypothetical protein [Mycobacteroides sp. CBMA 326]